jgi:hypothetical protein
MFRSSKKSTRPTQNIVGPELQNVLPQDAKPWYRTSHLLLLNLIMLVPLCSSAGVGFDGE